MAVVSRVEVALETTKAVGSAKKFERAMDGVAGATRNVNTATDQTRRRTATATANVQKFGIAFRSVLGPIVAITGAMTLLNRSLNVFAERQADANLLASGLKKIGAATGDLQKLQAIASDLGEQTLFNQEDFTKGFALLTSFRAIGQDSFERVATAAADMAATTKQDVNSSLLQLAKALENPVEGMSALSRSGTTFTQVQKDIVKGLVDSNKTLEAQSYILDLVEEQYRGNARAAAVGLAGAQDTLSESIRDFNEVVGQIALEPTIAATNALIDLFKVATSELTEWNKAFGKLGELSSQVTGGIDLVGNAIKNTTELLKLGIPGLSATLQMYEKVIALRGLLNAQDELPGTSEDSRPQQGAALDPDAIARFQRQLQLEDTFKKASQKSVTTGGAEDLLSKQLKSGTELSKQFQRQIELKEASTDLLRQELQIEFERQDALAKIAETAELGQQADLNALANKIALLETEEARAENAEKLAKIQAKADKDAADAAQRRLEADPGYQMQQQLEKLVDTQNQAAFAAESMGSAFADAFGDVVTGAKTGQEALAGMLKSIASDFLGMAKKIIAQQLAMILYGTIMKALGVSMPGGGGSPGGSAGVAGIGGGGLGDVFGNTSSFGTFAEGGYVNKPTNALIGEGGEPEYVIPESKMRESMSRYSRGSRGGGVIPSDGGSSASGDGGTAVAAPIDVRYTVERINNVEYVTADQFQSGMQRAAQQGAQRGEQNTLKRLQLSSGTRRRVGM